MSKSDMEKYPEERQILIHPLPLVPVSKCMEGSSVLTDIIIGKFMYHLPFYRLTQQYRESGIGISESTMCGWIPTRNPQRVEIEPFRFSFAYDGDTFCYCPSHIISHSG